MNNRSFLTFLLLATSVAGWSQSFSPEELENILSGVKPDIEHADSVLHEAKQELQKNRSKKGAKFICYNGHFPSASGLGDSIQEARKDAKLRLILNSCLRDKLYKSTNKCESLTTFLPPNTHPDKAIEALHYNDEVVYPKMFDYEVLDYCLGKRDSNRDPLDALKSRIYTRIYVGNVTGANYRLDCGEIDGEYNWIKNIYGERQDFRGERGYKWSHIYDDGLDLICSGK